MNQGKTQRTGRVFRKSTGNYFVKTDEGEVLCSISSTLRKHLVYPAADPSSLPRRVVAVEDIAMVDPVAVNDEVYFTDAGDGRGMITDILPRRSKFSRSAAGPKKQRKTGKPYEQVIVANVDQVIAVFAAVKPAPKWNLLDRYIAGAESLDLPSVVCITKMDIADEEELSDAMRPYEEIGYPVVLTSAVDGTGLDEFRAALKDKVSVLIGKSGVGKTSLLNAIQPGIDLRVNEISEATGKGKHTTSHLEMFEFDFGGSVVDTPGMREFGLWEGDEVDIAYLFREMRPFIGECKYGYDCSHTHEPGCAIKDAVEQGRIDEHRYRGYLQMVR